MDEQKLIEIFDDEIEIIETKDYKAEVDEHFRKIPDVARPLMSDAKQTIRKIEQMLYSTPSFINDVKTTIPDATLQAVLTDDQKSQLAKGALKLMTKKDGSIMANLVNPETKKNSIYYSIKGSPDDNRNVTSHDEFINADADGSNSRTDTRSSNCSRRSKKGSRI